MIPVVVIACLAVLAILIVGVVSFARDGDPRFRHKVMQWRIAAQAVAIVLVLIAVSVAST